MNEKKTFAEKFHAVIDKLGTMVLINLMYLIACIPIVTIGPAWNALLTALRYNIRGEKWFAGFKFGYKTRFWRSLIAWNVMLLPIAYFLPEINHHWQTEQFIPLLASVVVFLLLSMFLSALLVLNVYIPTPVGRWLRNAGDMVKTAPLQMVGAAAIFWAPLLLFLLAADIFFLIAIIFLATYYTLAALATTIFLKEKLVDFLVDARIDGVLLAEEGRNREQDPE